MMTPVRLLALAACDLRMRGSLRPAGPAWRVRVPSGWIWVRVMPTWVHQLMASRVMCPVWPWITIRFTTRWDRESRRWRRFLPTRPPPRGGHVRHVRPIRSRATPVRLAISGHAPTGAPRRQLLIPDPALFLAISGPLHFLQTGCMRRDPVFSNNR